MSTLFLPTELDGCIGTFDMGGQVDRTIMRFVRAMLALVIALSVAMLPTAGSAACILSSIQQGASEAASAKMVMTHEMVMTQETSGAMQDCCPDDAKGKPSDQSSHQCPFACCAAQSLSIAAAAGLQFNFAAMTGSPLPIPVDQVVCQNSGSPPFRPPRV